MIGYSGSVEYLGTGGNNWNPAQINQALKPGDQLKTGRNSRAEVRMGDGSVQRYFELTTLRIEAPAADGEAPIPNLRRGQGYLFNKDRSLQHRFGTPRVSGAIRGTEFHLSVAEDGHTVVTLLDGAIDLENEQGSLSLASGEEAVIEPGKAPVKNAVINAVNTIQWCLYYPAVLDPDELELDDASATALAGSLAAYRSGDLLKALAKWPEGREPANAAERVYRAATLLAVGQVTEATPLLDEVKNSERAVRLAAALQRMIAVVKGDSSALAPAEPGLATEWLAESYAHQARSDLPNALAAAQAASGKSPNFGFAGARAAELEFSFGQTERALAALEHSLTQSPRNAQALALKGFLLSAQGKYGLAADWFAQAIAVDGALANAWLGRGLVKIRQGDLRGGREDLLTAAALEPQRAVLRSYLGKVFTQTRETELAGREFTLARELDPNDPTSPLYSALLLHQQNRVNEAIRDLEKSKELNDHRSVYRSSLLLDQDRAVRSANLAALYRDAGLTEVSVNEASRAVRADYANYSSHLFLANSYNDLRSALGVNLRYETPAVTEYLLYSLLVPVGGGSLSRNISQQEYGRFFERDGHGVISVTDYASNGNWQESGGVYGNVGRIAYAVDSYYRADPGFRINQDIDQQSYSSQVKVQLTPQDSVFFQGVYSQAKAGDLVQYHNQASANSVIRVQENLEPLLLAGYAHEWTPGSVTLALAGRFDSRTLVNNPADLAATGAAGPGGTFIPLGPITANQRYRSEQEIYSGEVQHIWQQADHTLIGGVLYQGGTFDTQVRQDTPGGFIFAFPASGVMTDQTTSVDFSRFGIYGYHQWQMTDSLMLHSGLGYDRLRYPQNFRAAPVNGNTETTDRISPRAGIEWTPWRDTRVRLAYTRSLGGVSFDQSFRLEPTQVAGFNQSYRSLIPESLGSSVAAPTFDTYSTAVEQKFKTGTYVGLQAEQLESRQTRTFSSYLISFAPPGSTAFDLTEDQSYRERNLIAYVNQLIDRHWSVGARYRLSETDLDLQIRQITGNHTQLEGTLHQLDLYTVLNLQCGFFARTDAIWHRQSNRGFTPGQPGDDFWQFHVFAGYRFPRRLAELSVGLVNLTDADYQLSPVNLYADLPRERMVTVQFKFNF